MKPRQFAQTDRGASVEEWVPSVCGFCSIGCGVDIGVSGGEIVGVRGRTEHPVNRGRLGPKGLNQYYANRHPSRALHPMIRNRAGNLVRATWDEAMDLVVDRFNEVLATEGPDGVAIYNTGQLLLEEYYTIGKIARAGLATPNIDANTRLCTATTSMSLQESFGADGPPGCYEDLERTECIVLMGHNAAEQSTVLWMRILAAKQKKNPPKVIVIDPRRTLTVDSGADLHLQIKPGTNVALLNAICNELIVNDWIDRDFISKHCVKFGELRTVVARYSPDVAAAICGVAAEDIKLAAEWIGRSRSTVTTCLQGVYQSNQATIAACTVNSMHLLMGKIGKPGSAPFQFAGQPSSMNTRETGADGTYPAYRNWEDIRHMRDLAKRWHVAPELLGKKPVSAPEIFELVAEGHVKILWNIGTNPAVSMTDRVSQLQNLASVFLIVQDCFADTETARFADVLLPAAMWGEKTGCMTNAERRCSLLTKAVDPPGEARSDFDIFVDFSRRMGFTDKRGKPLVDFEVPEDAFNEWRAVSEGCIPDYSGMTYRKLKRGGIQWPCNSSHPKGTPRLYTTPQFPSDWRVAESFEKDLETGHEHTLREYRKSKDPDGRAFLIAADYEPPIETTDEEFPLMAISGRQIYHWHTRTKTSKSPQLQAGSPGVFIELHREDAKRLEIADGDMVRVISRRGMVEGPAKVGDVAARGVVFVPFHYGDLETNTAANNFTIRAWDPASKQPIQKVAAVRVERSGKKSYAWWKASNTNKSRKVAR